MDFLENHSPILESPGILLDLNGHQKRKGASLWCKSIGISRLSKSVNVCYKDAFQVAQQGQT